MTGVWALTDSELSTSLTRVFAEEQALAVQRLALVCEIEGRGLPQREGATSTVAWLRDMLRISVRSARQMVELAKALDANLSTTSQALADGVVNEEQALVIARAVNKLPSDTQNKAEDFLIDKAAVFEPTTLATLGGYLPAFVGLAGFGLVLRARELTLAAAVFAVSLTLRTLDDPLCGSFPTGTHFLWHCFNAIVLYLVSHYVIGRLTAVLRDSPRSGRR